MTHKAIICDIDGTIADNSHRQHWVRSKPKNWTAFNAMIADDLPIWEVIDTVNMFREEGYKLIIVTAREGTLEYVTRDWLARHYIEYDAYYMREAKDYRDDTIVKSEILDQIIADHPDWTPWIAFDDRDKVVAMWRQRGIKCFQVAPGDF